MATSKTITVTKTELQSMINAARTAGDSTGVYELSQVMFSLNNLGAIKANLTITYKQTTPVTIINDVKVNWMELPDGTKLM